MRQPADQEQLWLSVLLIDTPTFNQEELEGQQKVENQPAEEDSDSDEGVDRSGKE